MKSVLITGGAGFVGSHLAENFCRKGFKVIIVDNFSSGSRANLEGFSDDCFVLDLDVCQDWSTALQKVPAEVLQATQSVFHFASLASPPHYQAAPIETMWANSLGLSNALKFADSVGAHLTFASTSEVYGDPEKHPQIETYWGNVNSFGPRSCYDESKRFGEALLFSWNQVNQTQHGCVRIFNTYGPRMNFEDGRVVINFLMQAERGRALTVFGDGLQTRSFCYVSDLVQAIELYSEKKLSQPINTGNPIEFTILELAEQVMRMNESKKLEIEFKDLPKDDPRQRRPDISLAFKELQGWKPKVNLAEGLILMSDWLRKSLDKVNGYSK